MTQEVTKTTTENIDAFFGKLTEAADIVTAKLVAVAPEAAEAILRLVQFKGVFTLATDVIVAFALFLVTNKYAPPLLKWAKDDEYNPLPFAVILIAGIIGGILTIAVIIDLATFYNWVSAFYPEGAIALKALEAVGVSL